VIVYISGQITGQPNGNREAFSRAKEHITRLGHIAINPHVICAGLPETASHADFMRVCIPALCQCDRILLLPGWGQSEGATAELKVAQWCGIPVTTIEGDI
jgi:hypothetical protein